MKKTILALLLVLCLVCIAAVTVSAEETAHEHCVCNGTVSGNDAHTCESVVWTPISEALAEVGLTAETADFGKLPDGNYYLDTDLVVTALSSIGTSTTVKNDKGTTIDRTYTAKTLAIDLNGHKVTTTASRVFAGLYYGSKLTITDCVGTGSIEGGSTSKTTTGSILYTYAGSTLEIYGGNFVAPADTSANSYGLFCITADSYKEANGKAGLTTADQTHADNKTFCNIYGGNFVGGAAKTDSSVMVFWHNAQANIYGGTFTGSSVGRNGGVFAISGAGTNVKILGGTISGGAAAGCGDQIYISAGKLTLDTQFETLALGVKGVTVTLGENFSAEKVTVDSNDAEKKLMTVVSTFDNAAQLACFEAKNEGDKIYSNGAIQLLQADVDDGKHYACNCGGAYVTYHKNVGHTKCTLKNSWKDLAAFLAEQNIEAGAVYTIPAGSYYLSGDLTVDHYFDVLADTAVYIDLNGYTLTGGAQPTSDIPLLRVKKGGELNITDSSFDATAATAEEAFKGAIAVSGSLNYPLMYVNGGGLVRVYGGKFIFTGTQHKSAIICTSGEMRMFAGYINGGKSTTSGASICVYDSGSLMLWGGHIEGGEAASNGGNIYVNKTGSISIYDAIVSGGKANKGGNIYMAKGTLTMNGGQVIDGYATTSAGNIYIHGGYETKTDATTGVKSFTKNEATFNMKGGIVSGGVAGKQDADGKFTSGTAGNVAIYGQYGTTSYTIDEVTTTIGDAFLGKFNMTGGTITGGKSRNAGNVDCYGTMVMSGGIITEGFSENEAGNLRLYYVKNFDAEGNEITASSFTMNGGEITKGKSAANGGNFLTYGNTYLNAGKITDGEAAKMAGNLRPFRPANVTIEKDFVLSGGKAGSGGGNIAAGGSFSDAAGAWPAYCYLTIKADITGGTTEKSAANIYASSYTVVTVDGATVKGGEGDFDNYFSGNIDLTITGAADMGNVFLNNRDMTAQPTIDLSGMTGSMTLDAFVIGDIAVAAEDVTANVSAVEGKTLTYTAGAEGAKGTITLDSTEVININNASELTSIKVDPYTATYIAINSQLNGQYLSIVGATDVTVIFNGENIAKKDGGYVIELTGTPVNQLIVSSMAAEPVEMAAEINFKKGSENNPIVITDAAELTSVTAPAGGETYYAINSMLNGMTLNIVANENVTVTVNGVALAADANGLITVTLTGAPMNKVVVANAGTEDIELVAALEWPLGSENNPIIINTAAELTTVEAGKFYAISSMLNGKFLVIDETAGTVTLNGTALTAEGGKFVAELTGAPMNKLTVTATAAAEIADEEPVLIQKFDIDVARMILGNALEFQFGVATSKIPDKTGYYAVIEKTWADGTTTTKTIPAEEWGKSGNYHAVVYDGLAAKEMGDTFYVTIYNAKGQAVSNAREDSVRAYVERAYKSQSATGKTMMVDMLNYGAAAQVHFKYGTSDLANSKLTDAQKAVGTAGTPEMSNDQVKGTNYNGTRFILESRIQVQLAFKNMKSDMYAIYTYTNAAGKAQEVRVEGTDFVIIGGKPAGVELSALVYSDARALVDVTLYNADGTVYGTATDSIESCALRSNAEVFVALMKFADSAREHLY